MGKRYANPDKEDKTGGGLVSGRFQDDRVGELGWLKSSWRDGKWVQPLHGRLTEVVNDGEGKSQWKFRSKRLK